MSQWMSRWLATQNLFKIAGGIAISGFVLLSAMETRSLSAEEAAACECPLLLSDLPWARSTFGGHASYCPVVSPERAAGYLRKFYDAAPSLKPPPKPASWPEIARQFKAVYERMLNAPAG